MANDMSCAQTLKNVSLRAHLMSLLIVKKQMTEHLDAKHQVARRVGSVIMENALKGNEFVIIM